MQDVFLYRSSATEFSERRKNSDEVVSPSWDVVATSAVQRLQIPPAFVESNP